MWRYPNGRIRLVDRNRHFFSILTSCEASESFCPRRSVSNLNAGSAAADWLQAMYGELACS